VLWFFGTHVCIEVETAGSDMVRAFGESSLARTVVLFFDAGSYSAERRIGSTFLRLAYESPYSSLQVWEAVCALYGDSSCSQPQLCRRSF
jgi:hypothetical protein